ncbi:MAG: GPW/gp25 family protein [Oligoflexales bacterium]
MMCSVTGRFISDELEQVKRSIHDVLTTPKGSRCMNREYGSRLFDLVDEPINKIDIYAAVTEAIERYVTRFVIKKVICTAPTPGALEIEIEGIYTTRNQRLKTIVSI